MTEATPPSRSAPFLLTAPLSARTAAALACAVRSREASQLELRSVIEGCVRLLRERGMSAGAMLATMKAFVRHTMEELPSDARFPTAAANLLMDRIVSWSVEEFYRKAVRR
jgi:hypothetical protein